MKTIYFKTYQNWIKAQENYFWIVLGSSSCCCGESQTAYLMNQQTGKADEKLILCESCYNEVENILKGE